MAAIYKSKNNIYISFYEKKTEQKVGIINIRQELSKS